MISESSHATRCFAAHEQEFSFEIRLKDFFFPPTTT